MDQSGGFVESRDEGIVDVGFRGSFFAHGVFDPQIVSFFQIFREEFFECFFEIIAGEVRSRDEPNALFFKKRIKRFDASQGADSFVPVQ